MVLSMLIPIVYNLLYMALHVSPSGCFPRPLSPAEEHECFVQMKNGDKDARSKLIEHNLRLVAHIIKKYYSNFNEQEDLISIGTIGLIKAVSTFDFEKGTKFATYASRCIENEILMYFRGKKKTSMEVLIDDPIDTDKDGNALTLMDIIADETNIIDDIDLKIKSEKLYDYIASSLDEREQKIIYMRYGLRGYHPLTQREIAAKLKISRSYVSRIEKKAITDLSKLLGKDY